MKKLFLILFLFVTGSIYSQIPIKSGWNLGVDFGTSFNRMTTKDLSLDKGHWGITAGLTANYTFKNNIRQKFLAYFQFLRFLKQASNTKHISWILFI